jgi:hypothetical protein
MSAHAAKAEIRIRSASCRELTFHVALISGELDCSEPTFLSHQAASWQLILLTDDHRYRLPRV